MWVLPDKNLYYQSVSIKCWHDDMCFSSQQCRKQN
jgi:hypothetical protein